jgi:hypothetical protein
MGSTLFAATAGFIPDGPLHAEDAIRALGVGLAVGVALAVLDWRRGLPVVVLAAGVSLQEYRYPELLIDGFRDRPLPSNVLLGIAAAVGALAVLLWLVRIALADLMIATAAAVAVVWGIVPDTESAVLLGGVLIAAMAFTPPTGRARYGDAIVLLIPAIAAVLGSVGRPEQLETASKAAIATGLGVLLLAGVGRRLKAMQRQRAGRPTTVDPGSTSSTTTAPAPTTAP